MRDLNTNEVSSISGGLDHKDLAGLLGAYIGWEACKGFWSQDVAGYNVGSVLAGLGGAVVGNAVARLTEGLMDTYVDPVVDKVTG